MKLAIATTTQYAPTDTVRISCAQNMFRSAQQLEIPVYCIDNSPKPIHQQLLSSKNQYIHLIPGNPSDSMGARRRQAIATARDATGKNGHWAWTEPEKVGFPQSLHQLSRQLTEAKAALAIANRSPTCWQQLPNFQRVGERAINHVWQTITNTTLDIASGPKVGTYTAAEPFLKYQGQYGDLWESINIPIMDLLSNNRIVINASWDFKYPEQQIKQESSGPEIVEKRIAQAENLVNAIVSHDRKLHPSKS